MEFLCCIEGLILTLNREEGDSWQKELEDDIKSAVSSVRDDVSVKSSPKDKRDEEDDKFKSDFEDEESLNSSVLRDDTSIKSEMEEDAASVKSTRSTKSIVSAKSTKSAVSVVSAKSAASGKKSVEASDAESEDFQFAISF